MKLLDAIASASDCEGTRTGATCPDCLPPREALAFMRELADARSKLRQRHNRSRKPVSPGSEYLDDGSMVCPFGKIDGKPCSYHTYSGCSRD